jgi:hypothetical protein
VVVVQLLQHLVSLPLQALLDQMELIVLFLLLLHQEVVEERLVGMVMQDLMVDLAAAVATVVLVDLETLHQYHHHKEIMVDQVEEM